MQWGWDKMYMFYRWYNTLYKEKLGDSLLGNTRMYIFKWSLF